MVIAYQCPYSYRTRHFNGLMCQLLMDRSKHDYVEAHECVQAICAFGYYCLNSNRWECSEKGRGCTMKDRKEGQGNG